MAAVAAGARLSASDAALGIARRVSAVRARAVAAGCLAWLLVACAPAWAEDGITSDTIVIGQTAGFTGQVAAQVKEMTAAVRAYFDYVNRHGGINGRQLALKSLDDGYDARRAAGNARKLIVEDKVFALAFARGTPTSEAIVPVLAELGVPLVGPATGAQSLHEPFSRYVFNVRAKYRTEAARIVDHLAGIHVQRIAVLYQGNSFGKDALAGYEQGLRDHGLTPLAVVALDAANPAKDVAAAADKIAAVDPQAVVIAGPLQPTAAFIRNVKARGLTAQCFVLSNLSADSFIAALGDAAPGVVITQVVPYPWNIGTPLARELQAAIRESPEPGAVVSYTAMEGLVYAKVLVEGLRRAGKEPTRESFIHALENMRNVDLGGFVVTFGPHRREGSTYIDITMVGRDGKFIR